jgi:hypothetical protein
MARRIAHTQGVGFKIPPFLIDVLNSVPQEKILCSRSKSITELLSTNDLKMFR